MAKKNVEKETDIKDIKPEEQAAQDETVESQEALAAEEAIEENVADLLDAATVNEALCKLEDEKEEFKAALIQERADFENYKKRNADLSANSYKNGIADTVSAILPVLDNFERALAAESADQAFQDGMAMIMRQLQEVLKTLGVEEIPTDSKFDPTVHNAVMQVEEDGFETNDIVETMQKGYKLKDRILRHAMVRVNK